MKAEKFFHRKEARIKVEFPFDREIAATLKQIPDTRWSITKRVWHIPYTREAIIKLCELFPDIEATGIQEDSGWFRKEQKGPDKNVTFGETQEYISANFQNKSKNLQPDTKSVNIYVFGRQIAIKLKKNEADIHFIRSFRYSRWDPKQFCWIVPNYQDNLTLIKEYFAGRIGELINDHKLNTNSVSVPVINEKDLLIIKTISGSLRIIFGFKTDMMKAIKRMPFSKWNAQNKWWTIPYSEKLLNDIKGLAIQFKLHTIYEEEKQQSNKTFKISPFDIPNYRSCPAEYILKLKELRYSEQTIKSYSSMFEEFINYYHKFEINNIDESLIIGYLRYLVMERKISSSYQNQAINAIKFYYEKVLGGHRKVYLIDRPKSEKTLPMVLSEQEVCDILNVTENLKHKAILMTIYSAGLRISEALALQINDIDSSRMQIKVVQGKGKKDRYTILSPVTLEVLRRYYKVYKPKVWLFEGQTGEKYSARSIQSILRASLKKAKIKKHITVHTLRHSFATHLLENGTDLRYIQSLLGHESTKTTEVYTHVTTKGFDQIKSPLDGLKLDSKLDGK